MIYDVDPKPKIPILKRCYEWYLEDKSCDILDPDGFNRSNKHTGIFWNYMPVPYEYYKSHRDQCTFSSFNAYGHPQPFVHKKGDQGIWLEFIEQPIANMIFELISDLSLKKSLELSN
jgi:hypothetical protein